MKTRNVVVVSIAPLAAGCVAHPGPIVDLKGLDPEAFAKGRGQNMASEVNEPAWGRESRRFADAQFRLTPRLLFLALRSQLVFD
jgi:hypothetical protein